MTRLVRAAVVAFAVLAAGVGNAWSGTTADALREAARVYLQGDYATALSLWRPLADQGDAMAQTNIGIMYAKGQGVPQDFVRAYMWLNIAAAYGNNEAARYRDIVGSHMTQPQISEAQRLAEKWTRR